MENFDTRKLNAADYHKDHPYMKSLDKALSHYFVTKTEDPAEHGEDFEAIKIDILNSLFHPQAVYDKRVESPNKKQNMTQQSFGKYFDDQRDAMIKAMQNKNAQQNI